jgi:hypothetical protein
MRIIVITSCTGEKKFTPDAPLTKDEFLSLHNPGELEVFEQRLAQYQLPAEEMYTGQQHARLMRGVRAAQASNGNASVELWIVSAGYGLIPASRKIVPYECTFQGMKEKEIRSWADHLRVPGEIRKILGQPYDLGLVLLGDSYLKACGLDETVKLGGPTLFFCGSLAARKFPEIANARTVILSNPEAKRFSCGLVGLKGELASRLLDRLSTDAKLIDQLFDPSTDVLSRLDGDQPAPARLQQPVRIRPDVDRVIEIPTSWWQNPRREKLRYFIPEWDDLVDPEYDFVTDTHSGGRGEWSNEVYAHQLYPEPNYDGILISRAVAEKSKKKTARLSELGVHRYLRVPREFPILGDCGAFDYIASEVPPYETNDILDYYTRLGFDYGVSIDHLIVPAFEAQKEFRYELTIHNAEQFLKEHRAQGLRWEPIGAVQGWDPTSYANAARRYVEMGYRYIALGGLVRSSTPEILQVLEKVHKVVPQTVKVHLFGLARFRAITDFVRLGVHSIDSASALRKAWLGNNLNFLTMDGWYSAIRVPQVPKPGKRSFRAKRVIDSGAQSEEGLHRLEQDCLSGLRTYGTGAGTPPSSLLDLLVQYDTLIAGERKGTRERIQRTLEDRPWEKCGCAICSRWGIEVAIFRGNNRNRRRGFHNTHVFYRLIDRIIAGERIPWLDDDPASNGVGVQLKLFSAKP